MAKPLWLDAPLRGRLSRRSQTWPERTSSPTARTIATARDPVMSS